MSSALLARNDAAVESENLDLTVADAVWLGTALLHNDRPAQAQFSTDEIVRSVMENGLTRAAEKSVWQHVNQHCVANRKPQPNRARMLYATGGGFRRLFRDGDRYDPERADGRTHPDWNKLPPKYSYLRAWYEQKWNVHIASEIPDPLLELAGAGQGMFGPDPDLYLAELRSGWSADR